MPDRGLLALGTSVDVGRDEVRRAVEDVLSRPPYAELRRQGLRAWLDEARRRLAEWLGTVLGQDGTAIASWVLLGVASLLVLWLAVRWARRLTVDPAAPDDPLHGPARSPREWLDEAAAMAAVGDLREATRAGFRGVIAAYAEAGILEEVPGTTVGEYRVQVGVSAPSARASFDAAADEFEAVWYGHVAPSGEGLDRVVAAARRAGRAGVR